MATADHNTKKRSRSDGPYSALMRALGKSRPSKRARGVMPDPVPQRQVQPVHVGAAPLLVSQLAHMAERHVPAFNVSSAHQFVSVDDFMRVDGADDGTDMLQLLQRAGLVTTSAAPETSTSRGPVPAQKARRTSIKADAGAAYCALKLKTQLWPAQRDTIKFMKYIERERVLGSGGGLVANEMGQGKTLEILAFLMETLQDLCQRTGRPFGQPTLVVMPKTLLGQWQAEIIKHFPPRTFSVLVLSEAQNMDVTPETIMAQYNLVLTTYPTISTAYRSVTSAANAKRHSNYEVIYDVKWDRIIADEGHLFANRETYRFAAMCALQSHHRWILSGTPVLNDVHNVVAEMDFIGVAKDQLPILSSVRNERVAGTIAAERISERHRSIQTERDNFAYLLHMRDILSKLMIRNNDARHSFSRVVAIEHFETTAERDIYDHYLQRFRQTCVALQRRATSQRPYAVADGYSDPEDGGDDDADAEDDTGTGAQKPQRMVTVDILRLRQICASPGTVCDTEVPEHLVLDAGYPVEQRRRINTMTRMAAHAPPQHTRQGIPTLAYLTGLCLLTEKAPILPLAAPDPHADMQWVREQAAGQRGHAYWDALVPTRDTYDRLLATLMSARQRIVPYFGTKTRLFARYLVHKVPPGEKYIILSEWVRTLHNAHEAFSHLGIKSLLITGKHTSAERNATLREAANDPNCRVLLISLHIGSYGLNIPWANHVSQSALWWNPHTEAQARSRVLRPEQTKHCYFYNIVMAGTVEEDVLRMSNEKQYISRLLLENDRNTLDFIRATQKRLADADTPVATGESLLPAADTDISASLTDALKALTGNGSSSSETIAEHGEGSAVRVTFLGKRPSPSLARLVSRVLTSSSVSSVPASHV